MFSLLRKRFGVSKLHERLGTAGLAVAIVALVVALAGVAIAAPKFVTKPEAIKIAKKYAGKDGSTGPQGPAGPKGDKGDTGAAGAKGATGPVGATGSAGAAGATGTTGPTGATGAPWPAGGTLPSGATEAGSWFVTTSTEVGAGEFIGQTAISFPIPLSASRSVSTVVPVLKGQSAPAECDDGVGTPAGPEHPEADSGFMCVFVAKGPSEPSPFLNFQLSGADAGLGVSTSGMILLAYNGAGVLDEEIWGSYAITG